MKFEKPIMNISGFDVENIVTGSDFSAAQSKAQTKIDEITKQNGKAVMVTIQFNN
ncbi:MAG: hypothetical protein J1G06_08685 [Oscillospiraceae bacterium]|nr:hypothetical protein [Oscillospiraceae bacterium]